MYAQRGQTEAAVYQYDLAQKANDGDFYVMSEIDARLRELRRQFADEQKIDKPDRMPAGGRPNGRHQAVSMRASCAKIAALFAAPGLF